MGENLSNQFFIAAIIVEREGQSRRHCNLRVRSTSNKRDGITQSPWESC